GSAAVTLATSEPRLVAGSSCRSQASRSGSRLTSSAAASTGPSARNRRRAGGALGNVSGTSKRTPETLSLRPDGRSATPRLIFTFTFRPFTSSAKSASRITGKLSTGRNATELPTSSIDRPSSGTGGPEALSVGNGAFAAMTKRSTVPLWTWSIVQVRTFEATKNG